MSAPPLPFYWNGSAMLPKLPKACERHFKVGESYTLAEHKEQSSRSRNHYFAALNEAWKNLPENKASEYPSATHLRKWALVQAGYANDSTIVCKDHDAALKAGATVRSLEPYAVILISDDTVRVYTAQSQAKMDAPVFQESKQKVLDIVAGLIGTDAATLSKNAGAAA